MIQALVILGDRKCVAHFFAFRFILNIMCSSVSSACVFADDRSND